MRSTLIVVALAAVRLTQQSEPTLSKDAISVHEIRRGTMPLREIASGSVTSIDRPAATISTLRPVPAGTLRTGQPFTVQIVVETPQMISGTIRRIVRKGSGEITADLTFAQPLPQGAHVGAPVGALVDVGEARDVVFFERPADAKAETETTIFVIEPDGEHARRVTVKYGRLSGALMEILSGLSPGDRVIVTDTSAFAGDDRIRLK